MCKISNLVRGSTNNNNFSNNNTNDTVNNSIPVTPTTLPVLPLPPSEPKPPTKKPIAVGQTTSKIKVSCGNGIAQAVKKC
ncbi:hypothetical protein HQ545_07185 [Candidatus Woesearchaeota archaeon]|nr:hypothetical protein [Candidatus Woesearchaeota archaeon]